VEPGSVGVLGGTFDPIHVGHLAIAEEVREALGLERILFVPAAEPPHKPDRRISPADDRAAMVALAIAANPAFELSRVELDRPGPSYSVDTVEALLAGRSGGPAPASLYLILSAEAAVELPSWHEPRRLLALCRLVVVPRAGIGLPARWVEREFPDFPDRFVTIGGPDLAISGSIIRERLRVGRSVRYLLPDAVVAYIGDHGLYRDGGRAVETAPPAEASSVAPGRPDVR
jgi:nicotinate-nucleotide adenylyltransferase